jgi:acetate---CoA ligase (ADP-forming)
MHRLEPLLSPRSVAIVGASEQSWYGRLVLQNLKACGFTGDIYPINPKYDEIFGIKAYPSLISVGKPIDCVIVTIAKNRVLDVVEETAAIGTHAAVIFASGFSEVGDDEGRSLEVDLRQMANEKGIAICGPNCLGLINVKGQTALYGGPNPHLIRPGTVSAVLQSGSNAIGLGYSMIETGLGMSYLITAGNQVNTDIADYMDFLVEDESTRVIAAYIEGIKNPAHFIEVADKAAACNKPIVMLKVGRSKKAARAAVAHTGSLVGSDPVYDAVFAQHGVIRVNDFDELIATADLLSSSRKVSREGVAVLTISGGETGVISDLSEQMGIEFSSFSEKTREALRRTMPSYVTIANPFDSTGAGVIEKKVGPYAESLRLLLEDENTGLVVVSQDARDVVAAAGKYENELFRDIASIMVDAAAQTDKPIVALSPFSGKMDPQGESSLRAAGLSVLRGLHPGLQAVKNIIHYNRFQTRRRAEVHPGNTPRACAQEIREQLLSHSSKILSEFESSQILARYGIPMAESRIAHSEAELVKMVKQFARPMVLKALSPQISHRSDIGGVITDITTPEQALAAYYTIQENVHRNRPDATLTGILVQEMIPQGVEVIVGLYHDAQFGPVIVLGFGGIYVEILHDVAMRLPRITSQEANLMIQSLRGYPILKGSRGMKERDLAALSQVLLSISDLAADLGDMIAELDINPLIVLENGQGVKAVDALMVLKDIQTGSNPVETSGLPEETSQTLIYH